MGLRISHAKEKETIEDFGEQWLRYRDNEGYYGSLELFSDILGPLLSPDHFKDCRVAEIGSGAGRIVNMLLEAGAQHVIALEPSDAFKILRENLRQPERVTCLQTTGDQLPVYGDLDYILQWVSYIIYLIRNRSCKPLLRRYARRTVVCLGLWERRQRALPCLDQTSPYVHETPAPYYAGRPGEVHRLAIGTVYEIVPPHFAAPERVYSISAWENGPP